MLIEFKVANFRSIGEAQVLSLLPTTNQKEYIDNIFTDGKNEALNVIAIYGANGSGKSNLLTAFSIFIYLIQSTSKSSSTEKLPFDPFLLREGWAQKPTTFEIIFSLNELRYRYGFEYTEKEILKEWLFKKNVGREVPLFKREQDIIEPTTSLKGNSKVIDAAIEATRGNSLFLGSLDMLNVEEINGIYKHLGTHLSIDGIQTNAYGRLAGLWEGTYIKGLVTTHIKRLKLGLIDIDAQLESSANNNFGVANEYKIVARHRFYDKSGNPTKELHTWDFMDRESSGSIKALEIASPIVITLESGSVLIIDEIEAKMHPLLTLEVINLFLNKETNPKNAQLIFATHDTNLLSYAELRRDQIYFAEKNNWESTEIYSLSDFVYVNEENGGQSKERPDTDKEKRYIEGRYGAVPVLGPLAGLKSVKNG